METKKIAASFDDLVEAFVEYVSVTFDTAFNLISDMIEGILHGIEQVFLFPPFYVVIVVFGLLAWRTAGKSVAAFTVAGFLLCWAMNLWDETMITMALVIASVIITLLFGHPVGDRRRLQPQCQ
jgi:glycine betaine/proline transport system permease protein